MSSKLVAFTHHEISEDHFWPDFRKINTLNVLQLLCPSGADLAGTLWLALSNTPDVSEPSFEEKPTLLDLVWLLEHIWGRL